MKKMILGISIIICGIIIFCTDYAVNQIVSSMANVTAVGGVLSLSTIAGIVVIIGIVLTALGYREE